MIRLFAIAAVSVALIWAPGAAAQSAPNVEVEIWSWSIDPDETLMRLPVAARDIQSWVSAADYPAAARRQGKQGKIIAEVDVGTDDRILDCRIVRRAELTLLASAVCPILTRNGSFRHALAADGSPRVGKVGVTIHFALRDPDAPVLPLIMVSPPPPLYSRNAAPLDPADLIVRNAGSAVFPFREPKVGVRITPEGVVTSCRISDSAGTDEGDVRICRQVSATRFAPALDRAGKPATGYAALRPRLVH